MQYDSDYEVRLATLAALGGNTGVTYDSVYEIDLEILRLTEQGGGGGGTGTSIDDTVTSTTKTWSSSKINNELAGKQGALTAGDNITIANGVISASQPDLSGYALSADVATELADKEGKAPDAMLRAAMDQDELLVDYSPIDSFTSGVYRIGVKIQAGPDSEIVVGYGRVVAIDLSAFVGGEAYIQYITFDAFPIEGIYMNLVTRIYRNGAWGDAVSFVRPFVDDNNDLYIPNKSTYSVDKINSLLAAKQDTLTAGTNISIENNVISASQPDLSGYATSEDLNNGLSFKQDTLTAGTGIQIVDNVISATGGGGQSLSAGTNISIQNDLINALGYEYDSTLNAVKMGTGLNASGNNSVIVGQYNRSRTTSSGNTIFAIGVGTGTDNANRTNAIETLSNGKTYVNGVGGYTGQGMANTKPLDEAINEKVSSTSVVSIWSGTQQEYDAISTKDANTLYIIK